MDGGVFPGASAAGSAPQLGEKIVQKFQQKFALVQNILEQNRLLINAINQNHESKAPDDLSRNVGLIRQLNGNIRRVTELYADLSSSVVGSREGSLDGESTRTMSSERRGQKRTRPG